MIITTLALDDNNGNDVDSNEDASVNVVRVLRERSIPAAGQMLSAILSFFSESALM